MHAMITRSMAVVSLYVSSARPTSLTSPFPPHPSVFVRRAAVGAADGSRALQRAHAPAGGRGRGAQGAAAHHPGDLPAGAGRGEGQQGEGRGDHCHGRFTFQPRKTPPEPQTIPPFLRLCGRAGNRTRRSGPPSRKSSSWCKSKTGERRQGTLSRAHHDGLTCRRSLVFCNPPTERRPSSPAPSRPRLPVAAAPLSTPRARRRRSRRAYWRGSASASERRGMRGRPRAPAARSSMDSAPSSVSGCGCGRDPAAGCITVLILFTSLILRVMGFRLRSTLVSLFAFLSSEIFQPSSAQNRSRGCLSGRKAN